MAEFPSLPLFTDAIIADCYHLSDTEFGRYMRLLILMWRSPACRVPQDPNWLSKRLFCDALAYAEHVHPIMQEFCTQVTEDSSKWWVQKRLRKEYVYVQSLTEKRRNAAKKRWSIENKGKNSKQSICKADAPTPTPTPTPTPNNIKKNNKKEKISLSELSVDHIEHWLTEKRVSGKYLTIDEYELLEKFKDYCKSTGKTYKDYIAAYRNAFKWEDTPKKGNNTDGKTRKQRLDEAGKRGIAKAMAMEGYAVGEPSKPELLDFQRLREIT